jgi:DNA polymerase III subunit delta
MIIFLYGQDTYRSRKKLAEMVQKYLKEVDPSGRGITYLDGEKAKINQYSESITPVSLFARKRLVIIENIFSYKDNLLFEALPKLLEKLHDDLNDCIVLFWDSLADGSKLKSSPANFFKFLSDLKLAQNFKQLTALEFEKWIEQFADAKSLILQKNTMSHLALVSGGSLWYVDSELTKMASYKSAIESDQEKNIIKLEDLIEMSAGVVDLNIFQLTDALGSNNKAQAYKVLLNLLDSGTSETQLISMINRHFKNLLQIRQLLDQGYTTQKIISTLGLHPFAIQKGIIQSRHLSLQKIRRSLRGAAKLDWSIKNGLVNPTAGLSALVYSL